MTATYAVEATEQGDLFTADDSAAVAALIPQGGTKTPKRASGRSKADAFVDFHALNPWVADALERMLARLVANGCTRVGIDLLTAQLRWMTFLSTRSEDAFKFSNNHRPYYARLLRARRPEWAATDVLVVHETEHETDVAAAVERAEALTTWGAVA